MPPRARRKAAGSKRKAEAPAAPAEAVATDVSAADSDEGDVDPPVARSAKRGKRSRSTATADGNESGADVANGNGSGDDDSDNGSGSGSGSGSDEPEMETTQTYEGERDAEDRPHGRGVLTVTVVDVQQRERYRARQLKANSTSASASASQPAKEQSKAKAKTKGKAKGKGKCATGEGADDEDDDDSGEQVMVYRGTFARGEKCGLGVLSFSDGSALHGSWRSDEIDGFGTFVYRDGSVLEGIYRAGVLHGPAREYHTLTPGTSAAHHAAWHHTAMAFADAYDGVGKESGRKLIPRDIDALIGVKGATALPCLVPCACATPSAATTAATDSKQPAAASAATASAAATDFLFATAWFGGFELPPPNAQCFHAYSQRMSSPKPVPIPSSISTPTLPESAPVAASTSTSASAAAPSSSPSSSALSSLAGAVPCEFCELPHARCPVTGWRALRFIGSYEDDVRSGPGVLWLPDGGLYVGVWKGGEFHGSNNRYFYSSKLFAAPTASATAASAASARVSESLRGAWEDGAMTRAFHYVGAQRSEAETDTKSDTKTDAATTRGKPKAKTKAKPKSSPKARASGPVAYRRDESTAEVIASDPLCEEPYERLRSYAAVSSMSSASDHSPGEGLFARRAVAAHEVVSWYNGTRHSVSEIDARDWSLNANAITVDDEYDMTVVDVAAAWASTARYRASLGHKANHSFDPLKCNAKYAHCEHPRFGEIKCIRATRDIAAGEEICVRYGYDLADTVDSVPDWFRAEAKKYGVTA